MNKYTQDFDYECYYHVYNRTTLKRLLFIKDKDRYFFLSLLKKYITPYMDVLIYSLLDNHFHLFASVKSCISIENTIKLIPENKRTQTQQKFIKEEFESRKAHDIISAQFLRFFTSYSMMFNKNYKMRGSLFQRQFKRIEINNDVHFTNIIAYIHNNPVKHGLTENANNYKWSSLNVIENSIAKKDQVIDWFGDEKSMMGYIKLHAEQLHNDFFIE